MKAKPLTGKRVLLTRENNAALKEELQKRGAEVLEIPLIRVEHTVNKEDADDIMAEMGTYDWITFSSVNGVKGFFAEFFKRFDDIRTIGIARIACVGESTAKEIGKYYLRADVVPDVSSADAMLEKMAEYETLENLKVLCVMGNLSSPELAGKLESSHNAITDTIQVYETSLADLSKCDSPDLESFNKDGADAVVFASPSAVESFLKNMNFLSGGIKKADPKIVSIGPTTTAGAKKFMLKVAGESASPLPEAVADCLEKVLKKTRRP